MSLNIIQDLCGKKHQGINRIYELSYERTLCGKTLRYNLFKPRISRIKSMSIFQDYNLMKEQICEKSVVKNSEEYMFKPRILLISLMQ
jgi:hypothetical protein